MPADRKKEALETSIKEGCAANASAGFGDSYIAPFVLALNATPFAIGFLNAAAGILGPLGQLWGSKKIYNVSRKSLTLSFVLAQAILWLPLVAIGIYAYFAASSEKIVYIAILLYLALFTVGSIVYPAWFSWMGNLVDKKEYGRYFGRRNAITGAVNLFAMLLGAVLLDYFKASKYVMIGFAVLFAAAAATRLFSFYYLKKQYEPENREREDRVSFRQFMSKSGNLPRFARALSLFNFAIMIASPFFVVYMLKNLGFSYTTYMLVTVSGTLFYLLLMPPVGKFADRYGSTRLLRLACVLFAATPIMWIIGNPVWLIFGPQLLNGLANAALTVSTTNFAYDAIEKDKRGQYISYINVIVGIGVLVGSLVGGALLKYLPQNASLFLIFFAIAAIVRGVVALFVVPRIGEVRQIKALPKIAFDMLHPIKTAQTDAHFIKRIMS